MLRASEKKNFVEKTLNVPVGYLITLVCEQVLYSGEKRKWEEKGEKKERGDATTPQPGRR